MTGGAHSQMDYLEKQTKNKKTKQRYGMGFSVLKASSPFLHCLFGLQIIFQFYTAFLKNVGQFELETSDRFRVG